MRCIFTLKIFQNCVGKPFLFCFTVVFQTTVNALIIFVFYIFSDMYITQLQFFPSQKNKISEHICCKKKIYGFLRENYNAKNGEVSYYV